MEGYDGRFEQLQQNMAGKGHAQNVMNDLIEQRKLVSARVRQLNADCRSEQLDVDRLEERSLKALIMNLFGKREDALERERAELAAAVLKRDAAQRELESVEEMIDRQQRLINEADRAQEEYLRLLREKAGRIAEIGGAPAEELDELRVRILRHEENCRELSEAIREGERAKALAGRALDALKSADSWGSLDLFGGGIISDLQKYEAMDTARRHVEQMQTQLRRFSAELADLVMEARAELETDGVLRFADFFFDDIFSAIAAKDRIGRTRDSVTEALRRTDAVLRELAQRKYGEERAVAELGEALRNRIIQTEL